MSLAANATTLFAGGGNISHTAPERRFLVALNPATSAESLALPEPNFAVYALALDDQTLYIGGGFFRLDDTLPPFFAGLTLDDSVQNPPIATTSSASGVERTRAVLHGTVNARGLATTVTFQITTSSGNYTNARTVTATPGTISGSTNTAVTATVDGLTPATTYYYRVVASNSAGTTTGNQQSFKTERYAVLLPTIAR